MPETVLSFFTSGTAPATGLIPSIVIRRVDTALVVTSSQMSEVGGGWYSFSFIQYTGSLDYVMTIDGGVDSLDSRYTYAGNENFVPEIWGAQRSDHTDAGSMGQTMSHVSGTVDFLQQIESGRWEVTSGGEMVFYRSDNSTEIMRFDLFDITGSQTFINATERIRTS